MRQPAILREAPIVLERRAVAALFLLALLLGALSAFLF
jgi:hypothetical protein